MKFKVGGLTPEEDAVRVREARRAAGDDFALAVDANQGGRRPRRSGSASWWRTATCCGSRSPAAGRTTSGRCATSGSAAVVPVCAGQSEFSAAGCRDLMETGSIDFCNFDCSWSGGPTEWRRVAGMATVYDVRMAHHEEAHVAAHLLASIPHGTYLEYFHPAAGSDLAQPDSQPTGPSEAASPADRAGTRLGARPRTTSTSTASVSADVRHAKRTIIDE